MRKVRHSKKRLKAPGGGELGLNDSTIKNTLKVTHNKMAMIQEHLTDVVIPHHHDILSGKGNNVNNQPGNRFFRSLVKAVRIEYVDTKKIEKPLFAPTLVKLIRSLNPPGRFLKQDDDTKRYTEIGDKAAIAKTSQALREGAPAIKKKIDSGEITVLPVSTIAIVSIDKHEVAKISPFNLYLHSLT